ncbi:MAG: phosphate ABC transporter permease PstA [Pseudomonadales bacterium]|nr:phosphate ABC transporter permease PstA [Pseudomonadales bacterium]
MKQSTKAWFRQGDPWIWLNAGAVTISVVMVTGLLLLISVRGMGHFWPHAIVDATYTPKQGNAYHLVGEMTDEEWVSASRLRDSGVEVADNIDVIQRVLIKTGNRDISGLDFRWLIADEIKNITYPDELFTIERREWGNYYGIVKAIKENGIELNTNGELYAVLQQRMDRILELHNEISDIEGKDIGAINYGLEKIRLKERALELKGLLDDQNQARFQAERDEFDAQYTNFKETLDSLYNEISKDSLIAVSMGGIETEIKFSNIVNAYRPNAMNVLEKLMFYITQFYSFLSDDPREANTEGGIFPAIFGTVLMVILMSIIVTPFGVVAAVYLREYAKQGWTTKIIRIAVNNLAGVPSIVYGVFGLGFFVYFLGGSIDELFYPESAPSPVFGTPGLLWSSITLALLTVPVVIVATEEGLSRIPKAVREGSLALGATKFETLWNVVLPMSTPAMMTGLILAIARAAGEVAPLMLVGVVKLAPTLPLDGNAPFLHLDRKFMHLGFHIYDVGFQSPNVEASRPLVYATAFLLVAVIASLNITAVIIRNRLRERYRSLET